VARGYRPVERDQQFLLPPDMREWLPAGHPVWLLISVVSEHLDTSAFHAGRKLGGAGRAGYDPDMLLTLLIWAWSQGVRSSRRIERLCQQDVAFRVICAGDVPDHVTIHRFRAEFSNAVAALFAQVLMLCARLGLGQLGTIALDGTKIAANASKAANRDLEGLRRLAEQTEQAVQTAQAAAAEHAAADAAEDALFGRDGQGDTLPDDPNGPNGPNGPGGRRWSRSERIAAALAGMAAEQAAAEQAAAEQRQRAAEEHLGGREQGMAPVGRVPDEVAVEVAEVELARAISAQQAKLAAQQQRRANAAARGQKLPERPVVAVEDHYLVRRARQRLSAAHARRAGTAGSTGSGEAGSPRPVRNLTDPDSRLQPVRGGGWLQGYNCQAVTSADLLILATAVGTNPADVTYFQPMMTAAVAAADLIARHRSPQHPPAADTRDGDTRDDDTRDDDTRDDGIGILLADAGYLSVDNLTATGPDRLIAVGKARDVEAAARTKPAQGPTPGDAGVIAAMSHRLRTPDGIARYRQRSHLAETPFGHAKHNLGFTRFRGRGLTAATAEWTFHATVHNLFKAISSGHLATLVT
jgi:transposase